MGLNNTQRFRAVINGVVIGDCQVKDLNGNRFQQRDQRIAVWEALEKIAQGKRLSACGMVDSYGSTIRGVDVQVNLI
jgi:hypothetical protein